MAIFVTRPFPDNEKTAAALRAKGYEVLMSPMLRFEPLPFEHDPDVDYDAVLVTSANALRALQGDPDLERLQKLKVFAVGDASAEAARQMGFKSVASAAGDGVALRELVTKKLKKGKTLCYLAGADLSRDLDAELSERGFTIVTHTTYKMVPVPRFSGLVTSAFNAHGIDAVLHYSRRSARAFVEAVRVSGVEILALALPHCCISPAVAAIVHEAGANRVIAAATPDEAGVFEALERTVKAPAR